MGHDHFVDKSAFHLMSEQDSSLFPAKRERTSIKKRNGSNIRTVKQKGPLAPLQVHKEMNRSGQVGFKSAMPQRPRKGSDYVNVYTSSLPLSIRLQQQNQSKLKHSATGSSSVKGSQIVPGSSHKINSQQSDFSIRDLSVRD